MRVVHSIAGLLIVLTTLGGVTQTMARAAKACDLCSDRHSFGSGMLEAGRPPARAAASRERARAGIGTAARFIPFLHGVLPCGTFLPAHTLSGMPARAVDARSTALLFSSSLVRGPPTAI